MYGPAAPGHDQSPRTTLAVALNAVLGSSDKDRSSTNLILIFLNLVFPRLHLAPQSPDIVFGHVLGHPPPPFFRLLSFGGGLPFLRCITPTVNTTELHRQIARAKAGDERAFSKITDTYAPLLRRMAASLFMQGHDRQDMIQEGRLGLWAAVQGFTVGKMSFANFAELCVKRRMITAAGAASRLKHSPLNRAASMESSVGNHKDDWVDDCLRLETALVDPAPLPDEQLVSKDAAQALLERLGSHLTDFEAAVVAEMADGLSYAQVAANLGLNHKQVDNIITRVRVKAREIVLGDDDAFYTPKPLPVHPPPAECPRCGNRCGLEVLTLENGGDWEIACFMCGHLWWTRRRISATPEKYRWSAARTSPDEIQNLDEA